LVNGGNPVKVSFGYEVDKGKGFQHIAKFNEHN